MRVISVVTCEDVRTEKSGKSTLIGVGTGDYSIPDKGFPGSFGMWVLLDDEGSEIQSLFIKGICNKGTEHFKTPKISLEKFSKSSSNYNSLSFRSPIIPIFHSGSLTFYWSIDDQEWEEITTINITKNELSEPS